MNYDALIPHLSKECGLVTLTCPMGCGASFMRSQWEDHFETKCPKIEVTCTQCSEKIQKCGITTHNCIKDLKVKVTALEKEMQAMRLSNSQMEERMNKQIKELIERMEQPSTGAPTIMRKSKTFRGSKFFFMNQQTKVMKCGLHNQVLPKLTQGREYSSKSCDMCLNNMGSSFMMPRCFWHCSSCSEGGMDICQACSENDINYV